MAMTFWAFNPLHFLEAWGAFPFEQLSRGTPTAHVLASWRVVDTCVLGRPFFSSQTHCRGCTRPVALWVTAAQRCGPQRILSRATISNVQRRPSINHTERILLPKPKHLREKENILYVFPLISQEYPGCLSTRKCFFFLFCFLAE